MENQQEIWKDVKGYEGYYQVSNLGRIKSLLRNKKMHHGGIREYGNKISSQRKTDTGYFQVMLCKDSIKKYYMTHRLVLAAFVENINNLPQVNHINGIKTDNRLENLEWITQRDNQIHAIKNGLQKIATGEARGKACKLKQVDVDVIKLWLKLGVKNNLIAKHFGVNPVTISNIKTGATWKNA